MNNINNILTKGNLTGKERVLLLFKNEISKIYKSENTLTEDNIIALKNIPRAKSKSDFDYHNKNIQEYNKYINGSENFNHLLVYLEAQKMNILLKFASFSRTLNYSSANNTEKLDTIKKLFNHTEDEIKEYLIENTGIDFEYLRDKAKELNKEKDVIELINNNLIKTQKVQIELFEKEFEYEIITGENIYNLDEKYFFVKEYKKQIENILIIGYLLKFFEETNILSECQEIFETKNIFQNITVIYNTDVMFIFEKLEQELKQEIMMLKYELSILFENLEKEYYDNNQKDYCEIFIHKLFDDKKFKKIKKTTNKYLKEIEEKFKKNFRWEWE